MPTYHYRCASCGHAFDQFQRFSEDPLEECPECGGRVRRVPQPVGIVFKGSGWYITDSRKSNGTGGDRGGESAASETSASANGKEASGDRKPAGAAASASAD